MCKFESRCALCNYNIEIQVEQKNMNHVEIKLSSECPNLRPFTKIPLQFDAIYEVIAPKENSQFYRLLKQHHNHVERCTAYDSVIDSIGKNLGRYYELA
ncbi:MAG: hypothetical protein GX094_10535 [Clostridiales bacterium]|nr:hypothetical protein [Clostridiales bacterium]